MTNLEHAEKALGSVTGAINNSDAYARAHVYATLHLAEQLATTNKLLAQLVHDKDYRDIATKLANTQRSIVE